MSPRDSSDEVDELVQAWRRERDDLDLARRDAFTVQSIEPWEFDVLAALRRAGSPYQLSPGQLLRETMVTSGTMTNRIDRLTERGLVERSPDPHDRRGVLVGLTGTGRSAVDGAFETLIATERELLGELSAAERKQLAALLKRLMQPLR